jgi:hypothetical protein
MLFFLICVVRIHCNVSVICSAYVLIFPTIKYCLISSFHISLIRGNLVSIVSRFGGSIFAGVRYMFLLSKISRPNMKPTQPPIHYISGFFLVGKAAGALS